MLFVFSLRLSLSFFFDYFNLNFTSEAQFGFCQHLPLVYFDFNLIIQRFHFSNFIHDIHGQMTQKYCRKLFANFLLFLLLTYPSCLLLCRHVFCFYCRSIRTVVFSTVKNVRVLNSLNWPTEYCCRYSKTMWMSRNFTFIRCFCEMFAILFGCHFFAFTFFVDSTFEFEGA